MACTRYIEDNPVRANLVGQAEKWRWSSASAHISGQNDALVDVDPLLSIIKGDWRDFSGTEAVAYGNRRHPQACANRSPTGGMSVSSPAWNVCPAGNCGRENQRIGVIDILSPELRMP